MKKSLLAVLLAVALVAPVFATDKGAINVDVKAGISLSQDLTYDISTMGTNRSISYDLETTFSLGADFLYYVDSNIAVGVGIDRIFNTKIKNDANGDPKDSKVGYTNIYFQAKYDFVLNNNIFNNVYPILQIGYGFLDDDLYSSPGVTYEKENGLYWAIGAGATIKENFVVELLYSVDYGKINATLPPGLGDIAFTTDLTCKILRLNVGYKFGF